MPNQPRNAEKDALWWRDEEGPRAFSDWQCKGGGAWHWHPSSVETCPIPPGAC